MCSAPTQDKMSAVFSSRNIPSTMGAICWWAPLALSLSFPLSLLLYSSPSIPIHLSPSLSHLTPRLFSLSLSPSPSLSLTVHLSVTLAQKDQAGQSNLTVWDTQSSEMVVELIQKKQNGWYEHQQLNMTSYM